MSPLKTDADALAAFEAGKVKVEAAKKEEEEKVAKAKALKAFEQKKKEEEKESKSGWNPEEMAALAKAMAKYPGSVPGRWKKVANMVNDFGGNKRSIKQVIARVKVWELQKEKAGSGNSDDAFKRYQEQQDAKAAKDAASKDPTKKPAAEGKKKKGKKKGAKKKGAKKKPEEPWNADQQSAFEAALKSTPKSADRWEAISKKVEGKTRKQCVARFKEIKAQILAARAEAAAKEAAK